MKLNRERAFKRHDTFIKDAVANKNIEVTEADISKAVCKDHQKCAFALAIKRQTRAKWVDVSNSRVLIKTSARVATRWILSPIARKQVIYFDTHESRMAPCKLELKAPYKTSQAMGARTKRGRHYSRTKHRKSPKRTPTR